jgi:hypothetical protein
LVLSGEKLIDHPEFRKRLLERAPEAIGGEMEGAGLYAAAHQHHVDWILVKAISDWADGKKAQHKDENQALAARNAAEFVFYVLSQGGFAKKPVATAPSENWSKQRGAQLRQILTERVDLEESRTICFDLGIDFDDLRGEGRAAKVRELIRYLEQRNELHMLESWLRRHRSDIALPGGARAAEATPPTSGGTISISHSNVGDVVAGTLNKTSYHYAIPPSGPDKALQEAFLALRSGVETLAPVEHRAAARQQVARIEDATREKVLDLPLLEAAATWLVTRCPPLSGLVRAIVCHPAVTQRVAESGQTASFAQRFNHFVW